uniref:condensation domain-containing protein n=1 Tax=Streptomyces violaceorubidus TaxID=284042 RepID=UPI0005623C5B
KRQPHHIPLSHAQQRLWFLQKLEQTTYLYNISTAVRLRGALDHLALRAALGDVTRRHESLRTVFTEDADGAYQVVLDPGEDTVRLAVERVTAKELADRVTEATRYEFDLREEPPLRVWVFETAADDHVLLLVMHHIAGDGWSLSPLARDLSTAYTARHT